MPAQKLPTDASQHENQESCPTPACTHLLSVQPRRCKTPGKLLQRCSCLARSQSAQKRVFCTADLTPRMHTIQHNQLSTMLPCQWGALSSPTPHTHPHPQQPIASHQVCCDKHTVTGSCAARTPSAKTTTPIQPTPHMSSAGCELGAPSAVRASSSCHARSLVCSLPASCGLP